MRIKASGFGKFEFFENEGAPAIQISEEDSMSCSAMFDLNKTSPYEIKAEPLRSSSASKAEKALDVSCHFLFSI